QQQILIRITDPTPNGLPLDIYCFTNTTDWDKYEAIQSALLEHITTACNDFNLAIYTSSSLTIGQADPEDPTLSKITAATQEQDAPGAPGSTPSTT
ncbi:MAG: mechanosensitive ion channel, partial [Muribaculaceae bacterium]|nr:mechanosensitive ion channel [Muribaculaceae bacterium]